MPARYESVALIAHGGMARLELARMRGAHGFEKWVAVKRILPQWADEPEFVAMFMDEARLVAQLDHPNIVHVHDFASDDDGLYIAMEYIHGPSLLGILQALRKRGEPMPLRHAAAIGIGVAAGLAHAHTRVGADGTPLSIIHRDVSPTNVLVTYEGVVKLVDFGIAKAVSNEHRTTGTARKGKVAYMSPEQCKARPLDARSDIFALGALLYELVAGRRAFDAADELGVMNAIVNRDVVPPSQHRPDLPSSFEAIILQALRRDPDARPGSAREVERALEELDLRISRSALGEWVTQTVGRKPLPWAELSTPATPSVDASNATGEAPTRRDAPPLHEGLASRTSRRRHWAWAAIGAAAVGLGVGAMRWSRAQDEGGPESPAGDAEAARHGAAEAELEAAVAASAPDDDVDAPEDRATATPDPTAAVGPANAGHDDAPEPERGPSPASTSEPAAASDDAAKTKAEPRARPRSKRGRKPGRKTDARASPSPPPAEAFDPNGLAPRRRAD